VIRPAAMDGQPRFGTLLSENRIRETLVAAGVFSNIRKHAGKHGPGQSGHFHQIWPTFEPIVNVNNFDKFWGQGR